MKIAVAYDNEQIAQSFESCRQFAIYDYSGETVNERSRTLLNTEPEPRAIAALLSAQEAEAVLCNEMSGEAKNLLLSCGIIPVSGYSGHADTAADMLVTGTLPMGEGGCSGSCSGCAGGCGSQGCGGCGGDDDWDY